MNSASGSISKLILCLSYSTLFGQRGSSFDPSSTVQQTIYFEPLWVWQTMHRRHPTVHTPLLPFPLSDTAVVCFAVISTAPPRCGRLCSMHSEMHTHSYPTAPEAMAAAPLGRSAFAPSLVHHRARRKSAFSLRQGLTQPTLQSLGLTGRSFTAS